MALILHLREGRAFFVGRYRYVVREVLDPERLNLLNETTNQMLPVTSDDWMEDVEGIQFRAGFSKRDAKSHWVKLLVKASPVFIIRPDKEAKT